MTATFTTPSRKRLSTVRRVAGPFSAICAAIYKLLERDRVDITLKPSRAGISFRVDFEEKGAEEAYLAGIEEGAIGTGAAAALGVSRVGDLVRADALAVSGGGHEAEGGQAAERMLVEGGRGG
ncbi:hypothetical protein C8034_v004447, partial [Colletotrichum sidae]